MSGVGNKKSQTGTFPEGRVGSCVAVFGFDVGRLQQHGNTGL